MRCSIKLFGHKTFFFCESFGTTSLLEGLMSWGLNREKEEEKGVEGVDYHFILKIVEEVLEDLEDGSLGEDTFVW